VIESKPSTAWIFLTIFASGIIAQKFLSIPEPYLFPLFIFSAVFLLFLSIKFAKISNWFALIFIFITGIFCAGKAGIGYEKQIPFFPDKVISITGEVTDVKEKGPVLVLTIGNTSFFNGNRWIKSGVIVKTSLSQNKQVYESDWVLIDGIKSIRKEKNQIFIHARDYKIIESQSYYGRFRYKTQVFTENITRRWFRYHGQASSIFQMIVFGNSRQSPDVKDIFIQTGTYHLLIVSGIHLGYLLIFLRILVFPVRRFEQVHYKIFNLFYLTAVIFYSAITGFNTPVIRAALMFGIYLFSEIIERPISSIDSIGWAGSALLFSSPFNLFDLGFQLSFTATTGIVLTMKNIPSIKKVPSWVDSTIRTSIGAQFFTMPVLIGNIGTFYPAGFIANLFLVPFGGIVVGLGFIFLIVAFLRQIFILPLIKSIEFFWMGAKIFSTASPAICWTPGILMVIAIYLVIFMVIFRNKWKFFTLPAIFLTILWIGLNFISKPPAVKQSSCIVKDKENIIFFPCNKVLCLIEKKDITIALLSMKEDILTLAPAIEEIKSTGKDAVFMFVDYNHDIFEPLSIIVPQIKPVAVIDSPDIRKHPAYGYRKCFVLGEMNIKQKFWNFLSPFEGIRVVYNGKNSVVIEYRTKDKTNIISTYLNSKIFEVLPFSPQYHTIYATDIAFSKKLAGYLEEYGTKKLIYKKIVYNTVDIPCNFEVIKVKNNPISDH